MMLKPWMVAAVGVIVTLLALVLQEKITKSPTSFGQYVKALGFNGLLTFGIATWLLQWNHGKTVAFLSGGGLVPASSSLPSDVISGPPHF